MPKPARNLIGLSIVQKGLLLVAIPLLFQLVFLGSLFYLRHRAEGAIAAQEQHSKSIIATANEVGRLQVLYLQELFLYFLTHAGIHGQRSDRTSREIVLMLDQLQQLVRGDAIQESNVLSLKAETDKVLSLAKRLVDNSDELSSVMKSKTLADLVLHHSLNKSETKIVDYEQRNSETFSAQETNRMIDSLLGLGIVSSIAISALLATSVKRDLANHLNHIMRNIAAIGKDTEPSPPLSGNNELAKLDQFVVDTSTEINRARLRERALVDKSKDVICSLNSVLQFVRVSKSAERRWGYSDDELIGKSLSLVIHQNDFERVKDSLLKCINDVSCETTFEHTLPEELFPQCRWMRWTAVWSAADSSFFCVSRDVTAEKDVEQLRRDLSNMIAHDIRTPLQSATFFLETLMQQGIESRLTESSLTRAQNIHSSIEKMSQLLNDLIEIEKLDAQGIELNRIEIPVDSFILDAMSAVEHLAISRHIKIELDSIEDAKAFVDELRLNQVMQNLLTNAIKFSPDNSVILVKADCSEAGIEIRVIDKGSGIPEEEREIVFERFHQGTTRAKGFGLGLAICKRIVVAHGGTIAVEPSEAGCTILVRLPIEKGNGTLPVGGAGKNAADNNFDSI